MRETSAGCVVARKIFDGFDNLAINASSAMTNNCGSSTFLVGKRVGIGFSGGAYDTGKSISTDIGAG